MSSGRPCEERLRAAGEEAPLHQEEEHKNHGIGIWLNEEIHWDGSRWEGGGGGGEKEREREQDNHHK